MRFKALNMFVAAICLMAVATTAALATGSTWNDLSKEQQQKYMTLHDEFIKETASLRDAMWAKRVELNALMNNENIDADKVAALATEINKLRAEMRAQREQFAATVKSEMGIEPLANPHRGHGMRGNCPAGMKSNCPAGMKHGHKGGYGMGHGHGGGHGMPSDCGTMQAPAPAQQ